jgi:hypothetical protein
VAAHDDLEVELAALFRQMLHAHVVEDQQAWLEVTVENPVMPLEGFVVQEVTNAVEDAAVVDGEAVANQLSSDALDDVTFPTPGGPTKIASWCLRTKSPAARS